jgi:hypothetical protein
MGIQRSWTVVRLFAEGDTKCEEGSVRRADLSANDYGCFPHLLPDPNCLAFISLLRGFLSLKHGMPKHVAFSRLFRALDPDQFRDAL